MNGRIRFDDACRCDGSLPFPFNCGETKREKGERLLLRSTVSRPRGGEADGLLLCGLSLAKRKKKKKARKRREETSLSPGEQMQKEE